MFNETTLPRNERRCCPPGFADSEDKEANFIPGGWRNDAANDTGYYPVEAGRNRNLCKKAAKDIRDMLKDFFLILQKELYHGKMNL